MGYLIVSAIGSPAFARGFQLIPKGGRESDIGSITQVVGRSSKIWAGMGAALFLMVLTTSEALKTTMALRP